MSAARSLRWAALAFGLGAWTSDARAEDPRLSEARVSYRAGAQAYDAGDFGVAGPAFARADTLAPNETALRLALVSCARVEDAVLCMNLVERARARDALSDVRESVAARFAGRVARVVVSCGDAAPTCTARLDGVEVAAGPAWTLPGAHVLELGAGVAAERRTITLDAGASLTVVVPVTRDRALAVPAARPAPSTAVVVPPPTAPEAISPSSSRRLSPVWFWTLAGLTAAGGAASVASGLDTLDQHASFARAPTNSAAAAGHDAQARTNVLIIGTAAFAAVTAALGVFFVRWSSQASVARR